MTKRTRFHRQWFGRRFTQIEALETTKKVTCTYSGLFWKVPQNVTTLKIILKNIIRQWKGLCNAMHI